MPASTQHFDHESHVCLVWLKKNPADTISDQKKIEINEAHLRWELGGHSVSIWMLNHGFADIHGIEREGCPQRVFDIRTILEKYNYSEAFSKIKHFFLKIDILKFLIPLYIMEHGLSNKMFKNCIACDLDVGTDDEGSIHENGVFDLKYIYNYDTNDKLDSMGVVFAEGPNIRQVYYENSFAIFRNHTHVLESLTTFVTVLMSLSQHNISASDQTVWNWIPTFVQYLKGVRYGGTVTDTYGKEYSDLKLLFRGPYPNTYVSENYSHDLPNLLKRIPVPTSQFVGGRDIQGRGITPFFLALGLVALTFFMSFVPRS